MVQFKKKGITTQIIFLIIYSFIRYQVSQFRIKISVPPLNQSFESLMFLVTHVDNHMALLDFPFHIKCILAFKG